MQIFSKEKCREIDNECISEIGIPSIVLMENAGERICRKIKDFSKEFIIVAGTGNNGGDGLVIARKLSLLGKKVHIFVVGDLEKGTKDFETNLNILENMELKICKIDCKNINRLDSIINRESFIIDALFGVGLNRDVKDLYSDIIEIINKSERVISIDIPSGLDGNKGAPLGRAVKAYITYTIEVMKIGFIKNTAIEYIGKLEVIPIDIPKSIINNISEGVYILSKKDYIDKIPRRKKVSHKGNFGKVGIIAGSKEFIGAGFIVSEAAIKTGSGLVTLIVEKDIASIMKGRVIEAMVKEYGSTYEVEGIRDFNVMAIGPGLGKSLGAIKILTKVIYETECPLVIDADGLNIISENRDVLKNIKNRAILTPHLGEMSRLTGIDIKEIEANKIEISKKFAKENNIILLLKGYRTLITDGDTVYVNLTGNSKMASGGMGDCLTGIITSLVGQGLTLMEAGILGAYIHGYVGECLGNDRYTVSARDVIDNLPKIIEELLCEN